MPCELRRRNKRTTQEGSPNEFTTLPGVLLQPAQWATLRAFQATLQLVVIRTRPRPTRPVVVSTLNTTYGRTGSSLSFSSGIRFRRSWALCVRVEPNPASELDAIPHASFLRVRRSGHNTGSHLAEALLSFPQAQITKLTADPDFVKCAMP